MAIRSFYGPRFVLQEAPIDVAREDNPSSEPEPNSVVMSLDWSHFQTDNPQPADLLLIVEIADSTLGFDLKTKARLYARAEIAEYWVVDISGRRAIVHRDPVEGLYSSGVAYGDDESLSPLAARARQLIVREVFPA